MIAYRAHHPRITYSSTIRITYSTTTVYTLARSDRIPPTEWLPIQNSHQKQNNVRWNNVNQPPARKQRFVPMPICHKNRAKNEGFSHFLRQNSPRNSLADPPRLMFDVYTSHYVWTRMDGRMDRPPATGTRAIHGDKCPLDAHGGTGHRRNSDLKHRHSRSIRTPGRTRRGTQASTQTRAKLPRGQPHQLVSIPISCLDMVGYSDCATHCRFACREL